MKNKSLQEQRDGMALLSAYRIREERYIRDIDSSVFILEHKKTGAKLLLLPNEDENKVFTIGFRTPSLDSTGVAHIVEHTVLCGSRKYPAKDPFVELAKGSLNTFLNAMTYPDRTIYPIASCNDKDFENLMDVYLDAVFYPNIYHEENFFLQEGWHYAIEHADEPLEYSGVVYNEMKGVYSSVDDLLDRYASKAMFAGHAYGEDSGGDPEEIPNLSYEQFLNYHRTYYHPSNSFIYLYGDIDMAKTLEYIDREYLSAFDYLSVDSAVAEFHPGDTPKYADFSYSISEQESEENAGYLHWNVLCAKPDDVLVCNALSLIGYLLVHKPGAALEEALLDAGIGEEISGGFDSGLRYPGFYVTAKNCDPEKMPEFLAVIQGTLRKVVSSGIDQKDITAAINAAEFRKREADFGGYPRGLILGLSVFETWNYDMNPCIGLEYSKTFEELRKRAKEGYLEEIIQTYLLDNPAELRMVLRPDKGLAAQRENRLQQKLADQKKKMQEHEVEILINKARALEEFQNAGTPKEDLEKIPLLQLTDLKKEADVPHWEEKNLILHDRIAKVIHTEIFTSGINYIKVYFDIVSLSQDEIIHLTFLKELLTKLDTAQRSYAALSTEINLHVGGFGTGFSFTQNEHDPNKERYLFSVGGKAFHNKTQELFNLIHEILYQTQFTDKKRIREILAETKLREKERMLSSANAVGLCRAGSALKKGWMYLELTSGITYYRFLEELYADFDQRIDDLVSVFERIMEKIFTADNLIFQITADSTGYACFKDSAEQFLQRIPASGERGTGFAFEPRSGLDEAYTSSSMVNYVVRYANFKDHGYSYTGVLRVLKNLLNYDYLWKEVRVKGNAYGCSANFARNGGISLLSYRDPKLEKTFEIFAGMPEYVRDFSADEREMTRAIIGSISELDMPLTPSMKGARGFAAYISGISREDLQKERDEILNTKAEDIRALYPMMRDAFRDTYRAVIGNEAIIQSESGENTQIFALYRDNEV